MKLLLSKTILIVDDEKELCELIADELNFEGATVFQAHGGFEALKFLESNTVDAVLSDVMMPDGTGIDLLKGILEKKLNCILLLMTGYTKNSLDDIYAQGAQGVLFKPTKLDVIIENLCRLLEPINTRLGVEKVKDEKTKYFQIDITKQAESLTNLKLGRAGIFINEKSNFPKLNQPVEFKIKFNMSGSEVHVLCGEGICRWIREQNDEAATAEFGFGIEFTYLEKESLEFFSHYVETNKPVCYIPNN